MRGWWREREIALSGPRADARGIVFFWGGAGWRWGCGVGVGRKFGGIYWRTVTRRLGDEAATSLSASGYTDAGVILCGRRASGTVILLRAMRGWEQ